MPVSITKSSLSTKCIQSMVKKAFGACATSIEELTEGFFNIAYKIQVNHQFVILKVAPPHEIDIMTHEKNIMFSEIDSMRMIHEKTSLPVPAILFYDDSHTLCDRSYFFMEMLDGQSFSSCMEQLTTAETYDIHQEIGKLTKELNQISNTAFGYYCQKDKQGANWYEVFKSMIEDTYADAARKNVQRPVTKQQLLNCLEKDKAIFDEVTLPKFVHWDIWAGNVFLKDKKVVGIIDFERCLWADELMEVGFRTYGYEQGFFDGYGITELTSTQKRRAKWYDIYLFLIVSLEYTYRQYDNLDSYNWACDMLQEWYHKLTNLVQTMIIYLTFNSLTNSILLYYSLNYSFANTTITASVP